MRTIRWLPAVAFAAAACLSTPQAQAQTWLRWKKDAPVHDPARQPPRAVVVPVVPVVAAPVESIAPSSVRGPIITISEETTTADVPGLDSVSAAARTPGPKLLPHEPSPPLVAATPVMSATPHAPIRIEPAAVVEGASTPTTTADVKLAVAASTHRQAAADVPANRPISAAQTVPAASAVAVSAPARAMFPAPAPAAVPVASIHAPASPPVDPALLPATVAATTLPAPIEASGILAAPLDAPAICADCATTDELKATSARPRNSDPPPEGLEIQAEAKRRLLQGG